MSQLTYYDCLKNISAKELYDKLILYGLFSEKLPPIFNLESFLNYCHSNKGNWSNKQVGEYIKYKTMRNINIPRSIGIPNPIAHEMLCRHIMENGSDLQRYFYDITKEHTHKISRIHIRKNKNSPSLFEMNYQNWAVDGNIEPDLLVGKNYLIKADLATCFPSMYSHALAWALLGKTQAKNLKANHKHWANELDMYARNTKNGETNGFLIGPHTSNILSEIILCKIDDSLYQNGWKFVRHIDDYSCYVATKDEAHQFLLELNAALEEYALSLNTKKTKIIDLPIPHVTPWVRAIRAFHKPFQDNNKFMDYRDIENYIDTCLQLFKENDNNASIFLYALKAIKDYKLSIAAKKYLLNMMLHLCFIYPYLVPHLEPFVFKTTEAKIKDIQHPLDELYKQALVKRNYEACTYILYYAITMHFKLSVFNLDEAIKHNDCILLLMSYIYLTHTCSSQLEKLRLHAKFLIDSGRFDEYWIFIYECIDDRRMLPNVWKTLKKKQVTFLKKELFKL